MEKSQCLRTEAGHRPLETGMSDLKDSGARRRPNRDSWPARSGQLRQRAYGPMDEIPRKRNVPAS